MKFINLTPHIINIKREGFEKSYKPSGIVAGIKELKGEFNVDMIREDELTTIENLPTKKELTYYVVSMPTLLAMRSMGDNRKDVVTPISRGEGVVKDEKGRIFSVPGFRTF